MAAGNPVSVEKLKGIFSANLGSRPGERTLVFTDTVRPDEVIGEVDRGRREGLVLVARAAAQAARELGLDVVYHEYEALTTHGSEPREELWRLAFGDAAVDEFKASGVLDRIIAKTATDDDKKNAADITARHAAGAVRAVVALPNNSTSHTRFRDLLTSASGVRYASMPMFEADMLDGSMCVDWSEVEARSKKIAAAIEGADAARVTTALGTDITFSIAGRPPQLDTGNLRQPGSFSNLPAGEVYLAPVEGTGNGVLVLQWAPSRKLVSLVRVTVKDGMAAEVEGDEPFAAEFTASLDRAPMNRNLAELGIGTNDRASKPDNVLESEKILGTIHLAFGDNTSMGGKVSTPFHQDFVFFGPTLAVRKSGRWTNVIENGGQVV
ncbi:MAG TPA: aminopeptidase [Nitrospirota bacterium]